MKVSICLRIEEKTLKVIEALAKEKGIGTQDLIRYWIAEKISELEVVE
jgi:hypothetical protein